MVSLSSYAGTIAKGSEAINVTASYVADVNNEIATTPGGASAKDDFESSFYVSKSESSTVKDFKSTLKKIKKLADKNSVTLPDEVISALK